MSGGFQKAHIILQQIGMREQKLRRKAVTERGTENISDGMTQPPEEQSRRNKAKLHCYEQQSELWTPGFRSLLQNPHLREEDEAHALARAEELTHATWHEHRLPRKAQRATVQSRLEDLKLAQQELPQRYVAACLNSYENLATKYYGTSTASLLVTDLQTLLSQIGIDTQQFDWSPGGDLDMAFIWLTAGVNDHSAHAENADRMSFEDFLLISHHHIPLREAAFEFAEKLSLASASTMASLLFGNESKFSAPKK